MTDAAVSNNGEMKMNGHNQISPQSGFALILTLLLLFVMTLLGVSSFTNSLIQERSAANARLQTMALEAAAAGAINAINFYDANRDSTPDLLCGATNHVGWGNANPTAWVDQGQVGEAYLLQRMYCLADAYPCEESEPNCPVTRPPRSQLFVLSRGQIISGGKAVAIRDIEVRLMVGYVGGAATGACGAICFPACAPTPYDFPDSESFTVDGNGGFAISAGCDEVADEIRDSIRHNRIGNYIGGIGTSPAVSPFDSMYNTENFRLNILAAAQAAQAAGECAANCYTEGDIVFNGHGPYGTADDPQITYFTGNVEFGGSVVGNGILVVQGNLSWQGTPSFEGLIVVLGGTYTINAGGSGGNHAGSLIILNAQWIDNPTFDPIYDSEFGPTAFNSIGGGNADFTASCDELWKARDLLDDYGQSLYNPNCETGGPEIPYEAEPEELVIASWRENIGWREEYFGTF